MARMTRTVREVQPAHKSDKLTVRQAKKAWLKVEGETARGSTSGKPSATGQEVRSPKASTKK